MKQVSETTGRTVLFVSHNIGAVMTLCNRGIYLKSGAVQLIGTAQVAAHAYLTDGVQQGSTVRFDPTDRSAGNDHVRVLEARILGPSGKPQGTISVTESAMIEVEYEILNPTLHPRVNLHFCAEEGEYAFASIDSSVSPPNPGRYRSRMHLPANFLNAKGYRVSIYVSSFQPTQVHVELKDVLILNVTDEMTSSTRQGYSGPFPGVLRPLLHWDNLPA
jgi:lipopolysaccharide transport system ATP-binding protein